MSSSTYRTRAYLAAISPASMCAVICQLGGRVNKTGGQLPGPQSPGPYVRCSILRHDKRARINYDALARVLQVAYTGDQRCCEEFRQWRHHRVHSGESPRWMSPN